MIHRHTNIVNVSHIRYASSQSFEEVNSRLERQLGRYDTKAYQDMLKDPTQAKEAEKILQSQVGKSGFMLFEVQNHGLLLSLKGTLRIAKQYVIGNPLYAIRMTEHDIRAGLYAPLRIFVYVDSKEKVQVEYDLPSSLFGQFQNPKVDEVARELDLKLAALIENSISSNSQSDA